MATPVPFTTQLNCGSPVTSSAHHLVLYEFPDAPLLEVLDVANPLKPRLLCTLSPARGGRFDQSSNEVVFWTADKLGAVDLTSGTVVQTDQLPAAPFVGTYSPDGTMFAYRIGDADGRITTHVRGGGHDRTLYVQEPIGGHGGPPVGAGPFDHLEFSADSTMLLDFNAFRPATGPQNFLVYRTSGLLGSSAPPDTFRVYEATSAPSGAWSATGSTLYFFVPNVSNPHGGQLFALTADGQTHLVATGLSDLYWMRSAPQGGGLVYDAYVTSGPVDNCGGFPHLWRLDLTTGTAAQVASAISEEPVFVTPTTVWTNEEKPGECGPGGESARDGVILGHDMTTGAVAAVDTSSTVPGIGSPPAPPTTGNVLDAWF